MYCHTGSSKPVSQEYVSFQRVKCITSLSKMGHKFNCNLLTAPRHYPTKPCSRNFAIWNRHTMNSVSVRLGFQCIQLWHYHNVHCDNYRVHQWETYVWLPYPWGTTFFSDLSPWFLWNLNYLSWRECEIQWWCLHLHEFAV